MASIITSITMLMFNIAWADTITGKVGCRGGR